MVPNISGNGRSFRGAGAYHLHDKPTDADPRPRTSNRVAFTATRNLANEDAHAALDEMWRTAEDARHLKTWAGLAPSGRKCVTPVKTVSLAWAPGERPTREAMCGAADSFLQAMGWRGFQVLYVGHNDTRHPHLHLIINRVHPDTGRALSDWQERKRAQKWAHNYEERQGVALCPARAARHDQKRKSPRTGMPYRQAKLLKGRDAGERRVMATRVRAAFRPAWAAHYRQRRAALARINRDGRGMERMAASLAREGNAAGAVDLLQAFEHRRAQLLRSLDWQRAAIARSQYSTLRALVADPTASSPAPGGRGQGAPAQNGNHILRVSNPAQAPHQPRLLSHAPFARSAPATHPVPSRAAIAPRRAERTQLSALQAAASAALRPRRSAASQAAARVRAEISVAFAHRWAAIRRMPPAERAAAAAALNAEQAAALAARTREVLGELHRQQHVQRTQHRAHFAAQRSAIAHRFREAWAAAAARRRCGHAPVRPGSRPPAAPRSARYPSSSG